MSSDEKMTQETLEQRARSLSQRSNTSVETFENFGQHAHLLFSCGGQKFLLRLDQVHEILSNPTVTRIPCTPPEIAGVINLRGTIIDVVELDVLLGLTGPGTTRDEARRRTLLCEAKASIFGLRVDDVAGIVPITPDTMEELPASLSERMSRVLEGVVRYGSDRREVAALFSAVKAFASHEFDPVRRPPEGNREP